MKQIKKIISIVLSFVLVMTCFPTYVFAADHQQDGVNALLTDNTEWNGTTISQPTTRETIDGVEYYKIYTAEELAYIAQTGGDWLTYNYILANDIVLNDVELTYDASGNLTVDASTLNQWTPINGFSGVFNGGDFSISGVYVNTTSSAGFFTNFRGDLYDLTLRNSYVKGKNTVGGISSNSSKIGANFKGCTYYGAVVGESTVGGIVGSLSCVYFSDCINYGNVWATGNNVGGISGSYGAYELRNCVNEGNVYSTGNYVGGITGGSLDIYSISGCINKGNITGNKYVAGICSAGSDVGIWSCGNTGNIVGTEYVGGILGYNGTDTYESSISSGYNIGRINGTNYVGGIVGYATCCDLSSCYSVAQVSGTSNVGAIAGYSDTVWGRGTATNCYYYKDSTTNVGLTGFGNAPDAEGVVRSKKAGYFPILSDANADPSYSNLGYKNGETDDPIEDGSSEVQPPAAETVWDGTILKPSVMVSIDGIYYYKIYTGKELAYIAQTGGDWLTYNYILANDIVLNDVELTYDASGNLTVDATTLNQWKPINGFSGVFNGGDFSISGVYVNTTSSAGFFTNFSGDLYHLSIINSYIKGKSNVGGMFSSVSKVGGKIEYAYFDGAVVGNSNVGGLIGSANCTYAKNCGNYGDVWGTGSYVAGFSGSFSSYGIYDCFNNGNVYSTGDYVSGITGSISNYTISNCINRGNITGKNYVSGIVSNTRHSHVSSCGNLGNITGEKYVGGICAYNGEYLYTTSIGNSYNSGTITGSDHVGGVIGYLSSVSLSKCYNIGNVIGTTNVGAVAGYSDSIWGRGTVSNCCYLKNQITNAGLNGFGNADDAVGIVEAKESDFFCINLDRTLNMNGHEYDADNICDKDCDRCGCERVVQHSFSIITYPVEPTCSDTGEKHKECSICGEVEVEIIPARGHYISVPGKEMVDSYTLVNDSNAPFSFVDGWYASTNKSHGTTSVFEIHILYDCTMVLKYKVSSESGYDKLIILRNGSSIDTISGEISERTKTLDLAAGDVLYIKYSKDSSASNGADTGYFKVYSCTQTEIDTTVYISTDDIDPSCEEAVVCESCNQTMKEALGHNFAAEFEWGELHETCIATLSCKRGCGEQVSLECTVADDISGITSTQHTASVTFNGKTYSDVLTCNNYLISFVDLDGTVLDTHYYHYGDSVIEPDHPTKSADNTYTYTFAGWDKEITNCTGTATYTATYSSTYKEYTVKFLNDDGSIISEKAYHWNDEVTVPVDPNKAADNTYTYTFAGWDGEIVNCNGNVTYTATYTKEFIDYTIVFQDWNGTEISKDTYHYGDTVHVPNDPQRADEDICSFTFAGWDKEVAATCNGNVVYTAVYDAHYFGFLMSGTITSFGVSDGEVKLQLMQNGTEVVSAVSTDGNYSILVPEPGTYILVVSKLNHATRNYEITVERENVSLDLKIHLKGDINGDGRVNVSDVGKANAHAKKTKFLEGYEFVCADINGDGTINISDVGKINAHAKKTLPLW